MSQFLMSLFLFSIIRCAVMIGMICNKIRAFFGLVRPHGHEDVKASIKTLVEIMSLNRQTDRQLLSLKRKTRRFERVTETTRRSVQRIAERARRKELRKKYQGVQSTPIPKRRSEVGFVKTASQWREETALAEKRIRLDKALRKAAQIKRDAENKAARLEKDAKRKAEEAARIARVEDKLRTNKAAEKQHPAKIKGTAAKNEVETGEIKLDPKWVSEFSRLLKQETARERAIATERLKAVKALKPTEDELFSCFGLRLGLESIPSNPPETYDGFWFVICFEHSPDQFKFWLAGFKEMLAVHRRNRKAGVK